MQIAIPCSVMRGGTSKGLYFEASDLPSDRAVRDRVLLAAMGSPDERQIDGMGGAHPLTSKVAVISRSDREDADIDYLFLQVFVDRAEVTDSQNCGNLLAAVGPFAVEQGLVAAGAELTDVRIFMVNTGGIAVARLQTPGRKVEYAGAARIDGACRQRRCWNSASPDQLWRTTTGRAKTCRRNRSHLHRQRHAGGSAARRRFWQVRLRITGRAGGRPGTSFTP
jgi:2-methylaconitate cis-trans-isomerase PrpF